jgi:hypothetical protein
MEQSIQEIQNKIRVAATSAGIDPDIALSIANVESQFSNTAKNTLSSARGLFQIVDDTWDRFGGNSKLRNDIDENIRVGIKIIAASRDSYLKKYGVEPNKKEVYGLHFFGPLAYKVFSSDKDTPMKDIVPNYVLEANPFLKKMKQADLMNFLQTKMSKPIVGAPKSTAVAKNETVPVPMPQAPKETMQQSPTKATSPRIADLPKTVPSAPMDRDLLASLGPSYQAALGAISLADSAEDDEADELLVEKYAERFGDQTIDLPVPNALADVKLSYASPFEEAPVQMAKGGDPSIPFPTDMSFDDIPEMPPNPTPEQEAEFLRQVEEMDARAYWKRRGPNSADELNYSPSRKMLDNFKSNMPTEGNAGVQKMAFGGIPYKPSALISSAVKNQVTTAQSTLDAYNRDVNSYNDRLNDYNSQAEEYRRQAEDYNNQVNSYNEQRNQYLSSFIGGENPTLFTSFGGSYLGGGKAIPTKTPNLNVILGKSGKTPQYYIRQGDYRDLGEPSAPGDAPTFSASAPNAPTAPTQTVESANAAVAAAKEKQRRLQLTYDVMEDPERFNLSMPALFAEGGEALPELGSSASRDMQDYLNSSVSGNKDVLQGMVGGQATEGLDARLIGTYMQSLPPKFARQFLLNLELAKKAGVNLNKEGVANIYANIASGDTNYQIGYSPAQKSVNLSRMDGNSGIGLNIGKDNVGLNYTSRFAEGGEAEKSTSAKLFELYRKNTIDSPLFNWEALYKTLTPVQLRTFLETAAMPEETRKDRPVTEKDFKQDELRQILDTITTARKSRTAEKRYNSNYKPSAKEQKENDDLFKKAFGTSDAALQFEREKMQAEKDYFQSGKGSVNYMDYPGFLSGLRDSTLSKEGAVRNTLGRFVYETLPDGRIRVKDTYDFKDDLVKELGQRPSSAYAGMSNVGKLGTILVDTLNNPVDEQADSGFKVGRATLPSRMGSAFIGEKGRPVDITIDPRELMPGYAGYAKGGPVYRNAGSPVYGEEMDQSTSGGITPETRAALTNYEDFKKFSPREAFAALKNIYGEGISNAESLARGSFAAVPGTFGDIGQEFDIRGLRNLPTTEQLLAKYPQRLTQPTAETSKFENVGQYMPPPIPPSAVTGTAKTLMNAFKKAVPTGPTTDQLSRALFGGNTQDYRRATGDVVQATPQAAKAVEAVAPVARSADQLFVGRVDEFLANQKNPVTKEQLIGQLKGKFRDYEIARVEEALADVPAASKLQPADLLARVKSKYPVDNFRTSIIEPKSGVTYNNVDNVYKKNVGIINLTLPVADATRKTSDEAMTTLHNLEVFGNGGIYPDKIAEITTYLNEKGLSSSYKELLNSIKVVQNNPEIKKLTTVKEKLFDVRRAIEDPSLHPKEIEVFAKLQQKYPRTSMVELLPIRDVEIAKIGLKELTDLASDSQFKSLQPLASRLKRMIDSGENVKTSDIIGRINTEISIINQQVKPVMDKVVSKSAKEEYVKLGNELQKKKIYEGQHPSVTGKENPVAFSRFVDKEAIIPGMGKTKAMHIIELQSDLFDDIVKKGSKAGSKEKDLAEVVNLDKKAFQIEHSGPFQREAVDKIKQVRNKQYSTPAEKSEAYKDILDRYPDLKPQLIDYIKLTDRSSKLNARATIGNYERDEAFAGMEKSPQVLQQLMIKNSIGAAMQRGVNAITFPGKESEQAQLYEKLGPNLKQVVKDLGKGFEIRPIEMYDDLGNAYMHQGLVWSKDTAARVLKEGIRFNKGGAVDKNNLDYAKYI